MKFGISVLPGASCPCSSQTLKTERGVPCNPHASCETVWVGGQRWDERRDHGDARSVKQKGKHCWTDRSPRYLGYCTGTELVPGRVPLSHLHLLPGLRGPWAAHGGTDATQQLDITRAPQWQCSMTAWKTPWSPWDRISSMTAIDVRIAMITYEAWVAWLSPCPWVGD
jgi:hypothetical protein